MALSLFIGMYLGEQNPRCFVEIKREREKVGESERENERLFYHLAGLARIQAVFVLLL